MTQHLYHVEMVEQWQAVCRCGYRGPVRTDRVDAASYGTEHCMCYPNPDPKVAAQLDALVADGFFESWEVLPDADYH